MSTHQYMSADQYCTFLVEQGPEQQVGNCLRVQSCTVWSTQEVSGGVINWLAGNTGVVGPGGMGQQYRIVGRGQGRHSEHPQLVHWVQIDWTIDSGD